MQTFLDSFPVATAVHLIAAIALAIVFVANGGHLTGDELTFFGIILGANAGVAIGRGLITNRTPGQ